MKKTRIKYLADNFETVSKRDRIFLNNPVMIEAMALAPLVVAATSMKNALVIGLAVTIMLMPTRVIATFLSKKSYLRFKGLTFSIVSAIIFIFASWLCYKLFGNDAVNVGLYLPLLVLDPIIIKRYERAQTEKVATSFKKGCLATIGFLLALFLIASVREILGLGTFFGIKILQTPPAPIAQHVAGGFIIIGILAAIWRYLTNVLKRNLYLAVKQMEVE